jgi:hypothetical protein
LIISSQIYFNTTTTAAAAQSGVQTRDFMKQSHHAEGLVNPKVRAQKKVTDFGYPRAHFHIFQVVEHNFSHIL